MRPMAHEFRPGFATESGYDECDQCGLLVDPEVTTWVDLRCRFHPCDGTGNHGQPCVMVQEGDAAVCSYCDRPGGDADRAVLASEVGWVDELDLADEWEWDDDEDDDELV